MERIQSALQQYKQSQGTGARIGSPVGLSPSSIPVPLIYTRTRTVVPSQAAMMAHRVVTTTQGGPFLEAFKILRAQILSRLEENRWNVIGVTSPGSTEGKTLVAANLAISIAMDPNHTALLVDANLQAPKVHQLFGLENTGLADFLLDHGVLSALLVHPQIDRLVVLPGGGPVQHSVEALSLPKMKALLEEMKHRYSSRIVVVDLPPLLNRADVLALAPMLDAVVLVVEAGRTTENDIGKSLSLLQGVPILGTVLNKVK
ncbi:MAG TPA: CpsD/CapB family tyrosine-protein kinase [Nitrospirales bacterium]|nr:exopolysaccharide biosynthesis protein [Nitrospiraceae bacterium]HNP29177.1 CpsD/CapB family tyrosine-protein kinase [Nitrospirales bacterium]